MWLDQRTRVGTLRVRGGGADVPALRLAAAGRLGAAALELPASAPPSAILLVRRFADPLPGRFPRRGPPRPDRDWERAAQAELANLHRTAARPRRGELPADAPAVLFRDEAELIAVAALHLAQGGGAGGWWWRALLRFLPPAALAGAAPLLLAAEPQTAAAALAELHRLGREAAVLARFGDGEAERLAAAVAAAHSLPGPTVGGPFGVVPPPKRGIDQGAEPAARRRGGNPAETATSAPEAPWRGWLPAARTGRLTAAQELLLAVAVGLETAPAALRQVGFWRRAGEWRRHHQRAADPPPHRDEPATTTTTPETLPEPTPLHDAESNAPPAAGGREPRRAAQVQRRTHAWERIVEVAAGPAGDTGSAPTVREAAGAAAPDSRKTATPGAEGASASPAAGDDAPPAEPPHGWPETGVASALGGVFYLVHPLRLLDLPAACEADWELASRLGGWGTLDALARTLAPADAATDPLTDPLWRLLAQLAGREADEPPSLAGEPDLTAPRRFEPPAAWIADLGLSPATGAFDATLPTLAPLEPRLLAWLAGAVPFVTAALLRALGDEAPSLAALLRLPCTLFATATHVDVVAGLGGISLPARRAGLDRDPGWVPRLGRIVQFHFR